MMKLNRTLMMALAAAIALGTPAHALTKYTMLSSGYYDGPDVAGAVGFGDMFEKVPLGVELELGYAWSDTGNAELASQVFINQNQVGNPSESSGGTLHLALNAFYPIPVK